MGFSARFRAFIRSLLVASLVCAQSGLGGLARAEAPEDPLPKELGVEGSLNLEQVQRFKRENLSTYLHGAGSAARLDADLDAFLANATAAGMFVEQAEFRTWWAKNKQRIFNDQAKKKMRDLPFSFFATQMALTFAAEKAQALDAAAKPEERAQEPGNRYFAGFVDLFDGKVLSGLVAGVSAAAIVSAAGDKLKDLGLGFLKLLTYGPGIQIVNTGTEFFTGPLRNRVEQLSNSKIAPYFIWWKIFMSGEWLRSRRALKAAQSGKELTGDLARFKHPAISVKDDVAEKKKFYDVGLRASTKWNGWLPPELAQARKAGFDLIYNEYRTLGEQLNTYNTAIRAAKLERELLVKPQLSVHGAAPAEMAEFARLVGEQLEAKVFKGAQDPGVKAVEGPIQAILDEWLARGVPRHLIEALYQAEVDVFIGHNRPAFLLASVLETERYFQEGNLALKDLPEMLRWQEEAREVSGFYEELRKYEPQIQKYYEMRGSSYNVMARINQRGYPMGGPERPANVPPVGDCVRDYLRLKEGADAATAPLLRVVPNK